MSHKKQFVITREKLNLPDFECLPLEDGWLLYSHKDLRIQHDDRTGFVLIGTAWQNRPDRKEPLEAIRSIRDRDYHAFLSEEESWGGRYTAIYHGRIYQDACGLMSVFYNNHEVSSDPALLLRGRDAASLVYQTRQKMNWYPGPGTPFCGIKRLMPSQIYNLNDGVITIRELVPRFTPARQDMASILTEFIKCACHGLKELSKQFPDHQMLVALTGGVDSRAVLALSHMAGLNVHCFTVERTGMTVGDRYTPAEICDHVGVPYTFIKRDPDKFSRVRLDLYDQHTCGLARDEDRTMYAYGQYHELFEKYPKAVLLRGSVWESASDYFRRYFDNDQPYKYFYADFEVTPKMPEYTAMQDYFALCRHDPLRNTSLTNRFFMEQREGCWLSTIEKGFDLFDDVESFEFVNSRYLISMLAAFPEAVRRDKQQETWMTETCWKELMDVPYGGHDLVGDTRTKELKRKLDSLSNRLKTVGLKDTIGIYRRIAELREDKK